MFIAIITQVGDPAEDAVPNRITVMTPTGHCHTYNMCAYMYKHMYDIYIYDIYDIHI